MGTENPYRPGTAGHIIADSILDIVDEVNPVGLDSLFNNAFRALANGGHLTRTADVRIVKVVREMVKTKAIRKTDKGYLRVEDGR